MQTKELQVPKGYQWERLVFDLSADQTGWRPPYLSLITATKKVMAEQLLVGWNPAKPRTLMGQEIMACIKSYLPSEDAEKLRMYCAIGTVLDWHYRIDGLFTLGEKILPIDLKTGAPPYSAHYRGSFLLIQNECSGIRFWKPCSKIAAILTLKEHSDYLYTLTGD